MDLPFRIPVYEDQATGKAAVMANRFDYPAKRHSLPDDGDLRARYAADMAGAMQGIPPESIAGPPGDAMKSAGWVTIDSPHDVAATEERVMAAIDAQSDTVHFGRVDFAARSREEGVTLAPTVLVLFGGPGPWGRAMGSTPTLGLDAFCQKLLIWQDSNGMVRVTFNDREALAERQEVSGGMPLRIINRRLEKTFSEALEP